MKMVKDEANRQGFTFFRPNKRLVAAMPNYNHWQRELLEYELTDYISVPSQFAVDSFLECGIPESKLIKVPYGVDLKEFYPVKKEDDIFRIIHCGEISFRKGVHYLLQAFSELALQNSELWLVGPVAPEISDIIDKYKDKLEKEIDSGIKFVCISTTFFWDMKHLQKVISFFHQKDKVLT